MDNKNKQYLEDILQHLRNLICLMEYEDIDGMEKLVNMAIGLSAQIDYNDADEEWKEIVWS